ncbi:MAG: Na+/alanine symporter, partial [Arenicella sp.]
MKKILALLLLLVPFANFAAEKGLDQKIDETFGAYTGWFVSAIFSEIPFGANLSVPWVLIPLIGGAVFFTLYFKLINFSGFFTAINIVRGKYDKIESEGADDVDASESLHTVDGDNPDTVRVEKDDDHHGEVSHFQALTAALSATVGLGNIAGVAVALSIGGPGATFWMIVAGFIGMASKFTECTLGVKYREIDETGKVYGGPMYYLKKGLAAKGLAGVGKVLAVVFAIMCIGGSFGGGNMFQSNQAFAMIESYGQSDIEDYENIEETVGEQVKYNYFESEMFTLGAINKDSVALVNAEGKKTMIATNDLLEDSTAVVSGMGTLSDSAAVVALAGEDIVVSTATTMVGDVKSVENGMVTLVSGKDKLEVTTADYKESAVVSPLTGNGWIFGVIMAILVGIVIIGGIKKIAKVTDKIVPFMVAIYVGAALIILGMNFSQIPSAFEQIFTGAFTGAGITGGVFGVLIQGFRRAAFSNEAGIGSASIAHAAVKTKYPASEGLVALLEPFIDTVLVCTMTALVLIITNGDGSIMVYGEKVTQGVEVTSAAFESAISFFPLILTIAVVLFAFSTMISWSYYGYQAWTFLFGRGKKVEYTYKALFCMFVIVGAASQL